MSRYQMFDRSRLEVKPLAERVHDLDVEHWLALDDAAPPFEHPDLASVAAQIRGARGAGAARILMMGAHVLRAGVSRHIIDLVERGWIDHIAMNGAGAIHDYELARVGATTESVARYIRTGEFGLWRETGELNEWIREAAAQTLGLGENLGRRIESSDFPHKDLSVFAAAYRCGVPVTVHAGIGYDIIHEHPNCDGAALGAASYTDFLIFARAVERLEGGAVLSFGSAVMGPEVYLKALAMARNVARQEGRTIRTSRPPSSTCCRSAATSTPNCRKLIRLIISALTKRSWCGPSRTAEPASTFAATIGPRCRPCAGQSWHINK
jgi:hypothetical protein